MKVEKEYQERMSLNAFAEKYDLTLTIVERSPKDLRVGSSVIMRYYVEFKGTAITDGRLRSSAFGDGATPADAVEAYMRNISGARLVRGYGEDGMEIRVPILDSYELEP